MILATKNSEMLPQKREREKNSNTGILKWIQKNYHPEEYNHNKPT